MPKNEAKDRPEIDDKTEGTISRRSVLKIGAAAGAAGVLAPSMLTSTQAFAIDEPVRCDPLDANGQSNKSRTRSGSHTFCGQFHGSVSSNSSESEP